MRAIEFSVGAFISLLASCPVGAWAAPAHCVTSTPQHPFWVTNRSNQGQWVAAQDLAPGDRVLLVDGSEVTLKESHRVHPSAAPSTSPVHQANFQTYNMEVASNNTYFVGKAGIWVHNMCQIGHEGLPEHIHLNQIPYSTELWHNYLKGMYGRRNVERMLPPYRHEELIPASNFDSRLWSESPATVVMAGVVDKKEKLVYLLPYYLELEDADGIVMRLWKSETNSQTKKLADSLGIKGIWPANTTPKYTSRLVSLQQWVRKHALGRRTAPTTGLRDDYLWFRIVRSRGDLSKYDIIDDFTVYDRKPSPEWKAQVDRFIDNYLLHVDEAPRVPAYGVPEVER